ncbi:Hypothetical protein CINCED_3A003924, partial [Cinara cedri]
MYGFIPSPYNVQLPMCLLCNRILSNEAMKPSRLQEHLQKIHPDKQNKNLLFFTNIRDRCLKAPSVSGLLTTSSTQCDDGLIASYNISKLIAKSGKAHTIGEQLILPDIKEVLETVLHHSASYNVFKKVLLSNDTVRRRIDEMAEDVEVSLCELLEGKIIQEMLFARTLIADTKGESIFNTVKYYFKEKNIPLVNIMSVATDGAPAMHLVAKILSDRLHQSLRYIISAVDKIRSNSLNDRLFAQLCKDDEEFNRLILHTETDIAYMTDLFAKFNDINLQLQGDELNFITTKSIISAFQEKLTLWKHNFGRNEFGQFPILSDIHKNSKISFDDTQIYCQHLQSLDKDFSQRFEDILSLEVPQWVINTFVNIESVKLQYQELIEISTNEMLKASFKN